MEMIFSDWATTVGLREMSTHQTVDLRMTLLVRCPYFFSSDSPDPAGGNNYDHILRCETLGEILANPMWQKVSPEQDFKNPEAAVAPVSFRGQGSQVQALGSWDYTSDEDALIFGWVLTEATDGDPLDENVVCSARYNRLVFITSKEGPPVRSTTFTYETEGTERSHLFAFDLTDVDEKNRVRAWIGSPVLKMPPMKWESARSVHVWMDPTRTNYISNPSFQISAGGLTGWRSNAKNGIESIVGGRFRGLTSDLKCGKVGLYAGDPDLVVESNPFPTQNREGWTSQISIWIEHPNVEVRAGILLMPNDGNVDPGHLLYLNSGWRRLTAQTWFDIRNALPQVDGFKEGVLRLEARLIEGSDSAEVRLDDAIVEPNISNKGFFDGAYGMGFSTDFRWVNGSDDANASFSTFYNNRDAVQQFLFGTWIQIRDSVSMEETTAWSKGVAEEWVPEGVRVIDHWDDVSLKRTHSWMQDVPLPAYDYPDKSVVFDLENS